MTLEEARHRSPFLVRKEGSNALAALWGAACCWQSCRRGQSDRVSGPIWALLPDRLKVGV